MIEHGAPMTAKEAYNAIIGKKMYEFHAQDPAHVVLLQIRRHCEDIDFPTAAPTKHFRLVGENHFWPLDRPKKISSKKTHKERNFRRQWGASSLSDSFRALQDMHEKYIVLLRERLSAELRRLSPSTLELFAKSLLDVYGFEDTHVTQVTRDGGIDGYGKLRVGLAHLNVAFQCKRWTKGNIQRTEIDKFRGAAQGEYEQGIFFATTSFSPGAISASVKRGAVPIVLIDLAEIVRLMIEKRLGVQVESLEIPTYALDLALTSQKDERTASLDFSPRRRERSL